MKRLLIAILLLICVCSCGSSQTAVLKNDTGTSDAINSSNLTADEAKYLNSSKAIATNYRADLIYSMNILKSFGNKSITDIDALAATTSIYTLTSVNSRAYNQLKPPEKFSKYHNYLGGALANLMLMEWHLAKLYETGNSAYFNQSWVDANRSTSYYDKTMMELENITT